MTTTKMKLTLYHSHPSYFSAVARFALAEAGLEFESTLISLEDGSNVAPEYIALNPNGTIPTLVVVEENGTRRILTESRDILALAVSHSPSLRGPKKAEEFVERFYNGDLSYFYAAVASASDAVREMTVGKWRKRAEVAQAEAEKTADEGLKKAYLEKAETNRAKVAMVPSLGPPWGAESAARMINDVERVLLADGKQPDRDYLCGTEFSQADVCATCLFDMLTVQGHSQLIASRPSITCYLSRMRDRDGYKKGVEEWKLRLRK